MRPVARTHWLRENAAERSPRRVLIIDTETRPVSPSEPDAQVLRLWCATMIRRDDGERRRPRRGHFRGTTAGELADLVDGLARSDRTLWAFTHNLNFDLAVTELPLRLIERGWRMTEGALTTDSPWCRLAKGSRHLAIADSWSFLPASVEAIGELIGLPKVELPDVEDPEAAWWARCERDVAIVERALVSVMDWWDAGRRGCWSITGPATGWGSYRHMRPAPRVLVDPDPAARDLEARAIFGGRRGVWQLGTLPEGVYVDLDLATAHLQVVADKALPSRRIYRFETMALDDRHLAAREPRVLAECEVETNEPRYPWDSGQGVIYPRGRFRTVLAGPELGDALRRGELRAVGPGYVYATAPHMASWGRWLASLLDESTPDVPPAVRLLAKGWSRSVPGKWAGHTSDVIERRPDPRPGWAVERGYLSAGRRPADFLRIGGERWTIARDVWSDDAFPAILAWVQSWTRLAINRLVDAIGPGALIVNTDGVLVDATAVLAGHGADPIAGRWGPVRQLRELDRLVDGWQGPVAPFTLRIKAASRTVEIISPQHVILGGDRRLAGIPRRAVALSGGRYRFTAWPKLRVQLIRPQGPTYRTQRRTVNLAHVPPAGWLWRDGSVTPFRVEPDPATPGRSILVGVTGEPLSGLAAPERQHALVRRTYPVPARSA